MSVICKKCRQEFPCDEFGDSPAFDGHECPNVVKVERIPGESFADWEQRFMEANK